MAESEDDNDDGDALLLAALEIADLAESDDEAQAAIAELLGSTSPEE